MRKWEYHTSVHTSAISLAGLNTEELDVELNAMGQAGWELINAETGATQTTTPERNEPVG